MLDNSRSSSSSSDFDATRGQRRQLMLHLLLLPLLLMGWCSVSCHAGGIGDIKSAQQLRQGSHKLCGQELNTAMDMVCESGYNSLQKRRTDGLDTNSNSNLNTALYPSHGGFQWSPILSSIYGTEVLIKTRRMRRQMTGGIHDECCVNSCTYYELLAYCRQK
ncbi:hypothetical protein ACLKA6_010997 [Drosophila palustris]